MCIQVQQITYIHPDKEVLFRNLSFTVGKGRQLALIGNNGCGKSTLLQIMAGKLQPSSGNVLRPDDLYYVPQHFGQYDEMSIAQALGIDRKQKALHEILNGNASIDHFNILDDDWNIEEKALAALNGWGLGNRSLSESMHTLSGGEKTRVFLAGLELQAPSAVLMDEPTNHLHNHQQICPEVFHQRQAYPHQKQDHIHHRAQTATNDFFQCRAADRDEITRNKRSENN